MSGIAGVVADDGRPLDPGLAGRMVAAAPIRGVDGTTVWQQGPACLIRHAHATTPQAVGEVQPHAGRGGRWQLLLDGRIDNRGELIDLLARADCRDAVPDGALVLALLGRFGEAALDRLVGDWALALWDAEARSLLLARSPMGWRPLLWAHASGVFAFSTEPRALLRGLDLDPAPNEGAVAEYLANRFVTRTETLWRSVNQLEQGGAMRIVGGQVRAWHWHRLDAPIDERLSDADHIDRFDALFDQAIVATSRSSTRVWAQLSGGLDSSAVVTRAIRLHRAGAIAAPLEAVSARFPGLPHDETRWSAAVEDKLGIAARVVGSAGYDFADAHRWSAETYQLPVRPNAFDATVPALRLMAGEGARVLLTGEGGDDWMGGTAGRFADLLRQGRLLALVREGVSDHPGDPLWRQLARASWHGVAPRLSARARQRLLLPYVADVRAPLPPWVRPDWAGRIGLAGRLRAAAPSARFASLVQQHRYGNFDHPPRFLHFGNVLAMAERHGVEMRHPLHDLRLARFFMTAAPRMIRRGGLRKVLLRAAMEGELPEVVRTRRDKAEFSHNFALAIAGWLRERRVEELLPVRRGWVDAAMVATMAAPVRAYAGTLTPAILAAINPLWTMLALDVWLAEATG